MDEPKIRVLSPSNRRIEIIPQLLSVAVGYGEETYPEIDRISLEDNRFAFEAGDAIIVDVRSVEVFTAEHHPRTAQQVENLIEARHWSMERTHLYCWDTCGYRGRE